METILSEANDFVGDVMEPADVTQLLTVIDDIKLMVEAVISGTFLLAGVIVGVMVMFIFFFFLKGAE